MTRATVIASVMVIAGTVAGVWLFANRDPDPEATAATALFGEYCVDCHNAIDLAGSMRLDDKDFRARRDGRRDLGARRAQAQDRHDAAGRRAAAAPRDASTR